MRVEVWAPFAATVRVRTAEPGQMGDAAAQTASLDAQGQGWFGADVAGATPGRDYGFLLDDEDAVLPDPRSRWQPSGVDGPSRFVDHTFEWSDADWTGRGLPNAVFYELHVGTFTPLGTFDSAVDRLDHLADLGVTHVELLPVNEFDGRYNWGYDGVFWYAVHDQYGGPAGLKRFVDACHVRGLAVTLDVVYNHLGPSGNVLPRFGPYLKAGKSTWGDLINLDGSDAGPVRQYVVENALMWLSEFHVDALRLDAVHALKDTSELHILAELSERVNELAAELRRPLLLVAESDLNDPVMVTPRSAGGYGLDAQWDDDVHHALHALLTGERQGYYVDFGSLATLATALTRAFVHAGTFSTFRGHVHGKPVDRQKVPGYRFVASLQNHDQVGNRAAGDRLSALVSDDLLKVGVVLLLTSAFTPLLWMGEEWAASTPWPFFTSHEDPELAAATSKGRLAEFGKHGWDPSTMVDPQDPEAFRSAHLDWSERRSDGHHDVLELYRTLLRLRRELPEFGDTRLDDLRVEADDASQVIRVRRGHLTIVANLSRDWRVVAADSPELLLVTAAETGIVADGARIAPESAAIIRSQ
jgi:maltooligosyltrehalose trehalohydrolase